MTKSISQKMTISNLECISFCNRNNCTGPFINEQVFLLMQLRRCQLVEVTVGGEVQ